MLQKTTALYILNIYYYTHLVNSVSALGWGWWEMLVLVGGEDFCCLEYFGFSEESVALGKDLAAAGGSDAQTGTFLAAKFPGRLGAVSERCPHVTDPTTHISAEEIAHCSPHKEA